MCRSSCGVWQFLAVVWNRDGRTPVRLGVRRIRSPPAAESVPAGSAPAARTAPLNCSGSLAGGWPPVAGHRPSPGPISARRSRDGRSRALIDYQACPGGWLGCRRNGILARANGPGTAVGLHIGDATESEVRPQCQSPNQPECVGKRRQAPPCKAAYRVVSMTQTRLRPTGICTSGPSTLPVAWPRAAHQLGQTPRMHLDAGMAAGMDVGLCHPLL